MDLLKLQPYSFKVLYFLKDKTISSITMICNACLISRPAAKAALDDLLDNGLISTEKEGTVFHVSIMQELKWT